MAPLRSRPFAGTGRTAGLFLLWLLLAAPVALLVFAASSRTIVVAGHDADVSPTWDGYATLDLGPYIPSFRVPTDHRLGAHLDVGATSLPTYDALLERYAFIASQPEAQVAKVRDTVVDLAVDSALVGALVGLVGPGLVLLVGRRRWRELLHPWTVRRSLVVLVGVAAVSTTVVAVRGGAGPVVEHEPWQPLSVALPAVEVPPEAAAVEIESGLVSRGTRRLVASAIGSYRKSLDFYQTLVQRAPGLSDELRQPRDGEVVALLVSDRHDNIGMDPVARAVADAGGATFLLDAGDDTSTGSPWEAFSLESLAEAFSDFDDRYAVAGNHDHGTFVVEQWERLGVTTLDGEVVEGPAGVRLLGASDVRSSGLGAWRDEGDVSFSDQQLLIAEEACARDQAGERVATLLVHDANSGRIALERGCVDLVVAGHLHLQVGPERVVGANGRVGYSFTNGTTGGAAYAVAIGSKLRRDAQVTLLTYDEGRPVGVQPVTVRTNGEMHAGDYVPLALDDPEEQ